MKSKGVGMNVHQLKILEQLSLFEKHVDSYDTTWF
jgi:hypothetical protein